MEVELSPEAFRPVGQMLEHVEPSGEVCDGFRIRRSFVSTLARVLPVTDGLLNQARLGAMVGEQFGLDLGRLRKSLGKHLSDPLMELLASALQQRMVGRLLDQRMLEGVDRVRRGAAPVHEFRIHETSQGVLQRWLLYWRHGPEQFIGE